MSEYSKDNIFYKMVVGEVEVHKVYETDYCMFIWDIQPSAPTHLLCISKLLYVNFSELMNSEDDYILFMKDFRKAIKHLESKGLVKHRIITNSIYYQMIYHLHIHVLSDVPIGDIKL